MCRFPECHHLALRGMKWQRQSPYGEPNMADQLHLDFDTPPRRTRATNRRSTATNHRCRRTPRPCRACLGRHRLADRRCHQDRRQDSRHGRPPPWPRSSRPSGRTRISLRPGGGISSRRCARRRACATCRRRSCRPSRAISVPGYAISTRLRWACRANGSAMSLADLVQALRLANHRVSGRADAGAAHPGMAGASCGLPNPMVPVAAGSVHAVEQRAGHSHPPWSIRRRSTRS